MWHQPVSFFQFVQLDPDNEDDEKMECLPGKYVIKSPAVELQVVHTGDYTDQVAAELADRMASMAGAGGAALLGASVAWMLCSCGGCIGCIGCIVSLASEAPHHGGSGD